MAEKIANNVFGLKITMYLSWNKIVFLTPCIRLFFWVAHILNSMQAAIRISCSKHHQCAKIHWHGKNWYLILKITNVF